MKTYSLFSKRLALGLAVSVGAVALSASTVFAWTRPEAGNVSSPSNAVSLWNDCGIGEGNPNGIWAQDGDVVTTTKWNQYICRFLQLQSVLFDWGRGKTPFIWHANTNTIDGQKGQYVGVILLAEPGGGGGVNFYDANRQFPQDPDGRSNVLGSVQYHRPNQPGFEQAKEGLHLTSTNGPVFIDTCLGTAINPYCDDATNAGYPSESPGQYPIGWTDVPLYDTAPFDNRCIYRFRHTDNTSMRYPIWVTPDEISSSRPYASQGAGLRVSFGYITAAAKNTYRVEDTNSAGVVSSYNLTVAKMEKLCLPSYTSGVNMDQAYHVYPNHGN